MTWAEQQLLGLLADARVPQKASYTTSEVQAILGISDATCRRLLNEYERGTDGAPVRPDALDAFLTQGVGHYRVPHRELVRYLTDNNANERKHGLPTTQPPSPLPAREALRKPDPPQPVRARKNNPSPGPRQPGLFDAILEGSE